jgi:hypothetical protein
MEAVEGSAPMAIRFAIRSWAACASGLTSPAEWQAWAGNPHLPVGGAGAAVTGMPPMLRRRLGSLGRAAAEVAWAAQPAPGAMPVILASRYGDAGRALNLLEQFAVAGDMSPTDFALSVHNAIGAMYSIARKDTQAYASVAAGAASAAAGAVEAAALLAAGADEVLLVCYDAPLPGDYACFHDEPAAEYAWAWRIGVAAPGQPAMALAWEPSGEEPDGAALPYGLDVLRFALGDAPSWSRPSGGTRWTWSRCDG